MKKVKTAVTLLALLSVLSCAYILPRYMREKKMRELGGGGAGEVFAPNYQVDTVTTLSGEITKIGRFIAEPMKIKSVRIFVKTGRKTYEAHLGPAWYLKKQPFRLDVGDRITLTGSLINGKIMIQSFENNGKTYLMRDKRGEPKWFRSVSIEAADSGLLTGAGPPKQ